MGAGNDPPEIHWTHKLFVKHPELYLPILKRNLEQGEKEVLGLCQLFDKYRIPEGAKILDICCGIGRHSIPLFKRGYEVVGYDLSPLYIDESKKRVEQEINKLKINKNETYLNNDNNKIRFYTGDLRNIVKTLKMNGEKEFDVILSLFTSLGYYNEDQDQKLFGDLLQESSNIGLIIVDVINRDYLLSNFQEWGVDEFNDIELHSKRQFNVEDSLIENIWKFYRKSCNSFNDTYLKLILQIYATLRVYSLHEIKGMMNKAGWQYIESYSNLDELKLFDFKNNRLVMIGKKS